MYIKEHSMSKDSDFNFDEMERAASDPLEAYSIKELLSALSKKTITMVFAGVTPKDGGASISVKSMTKGKRKHLDTCMKDLGDKVDQLKWGPGEDMI